jgi:redox-sensing transcriptional repressor
MAPKDVMVENVHLSESLLTLTCLMNKLIWYKLFI